MFRRISLWAALIVMVGLPSALRAQVPDVQGVCVSGCGGGSGNSDARERQLARNHATHAQHVQWFNEVERRWKSAAKTGNDLSHKGQKAQAKGDCTGAMADFQREVAVFSVDLTPRGNLVDAILNGKYQGMLYQQQAAVTAARGRIASAQAVCFQPRPTPPVAVAAYRKPNPVSAAGPAPNNAPPVENIRLEPATEGANSCYRADPARSSCLELRNNSKRRVRMYVEGLPGVQCTVDPGSYCSLPMAIGQLHLRVIPDDEQGNGPAIQTDINLAFAGTRLTVGPGN